MNLMLKAAYSDDQVVVKTVANHCLRLINTTNQYPLQIFFGRQTPQRFHSSTIHQKLRLVLPHWKRRGGRAVPADVSDIKFSTPPIHSKLLCGTRWSNFFDSKMEFVAQVCREAHRPLLERS